MEKDEHREALSTGRTIYLHNPDGLLALNPLAELPFSEAVEHLQDGQDEKAAPGAAMAGDVSKLSD